MIRSAVASLPLDRPPSPPQYRRPPGLRFGSVAEPAQVVVFGQACGASSRPPHTPAHETYFLALLAFAIRAGSTTAPAAYAPAGGKIDVSTIRAITYAGISSASL